jgi:predicted DCC family thiol-disulfide oxidoreductase YuxK
MKTGKFLTAEWRYLAMINYEVDPAILLPFVPRGTEFDKWKERTFVSIVGFRFLKTLVLGLPIPFHHNFDEINLRFYVRRPAAEGWRRGVVFIKEIVPRQAIATAARVIYNENYVAREMRHEIGFHEGESRQRGSVGYGWREGKKWNCSQGCKNMIEPGTDYLLFDGDCGICTYSSEIAKKMDSEGRFVIKPYQSFAEAELMRFRVNYQQCSKNLQVITRKGRVYQGAFSVNYFLWHQHTWSPLVFLIYAIPPLLLLEMIGYRLVADNRHRISQWFGMNACVLKDEG